MEDFGSIQHMSLPESTLLQAIVNTQVGQQLTSCRPVRIKYLSRVAHSAHRLVSRGEPHLKKSHKKSENKIKLLS